MKKTWIKSISLPLACCLGIGVITATIAVNNKQSNPVQVDAATTTTATLTKQDLLDHTTTIQKNTWGDWEWRRIKNQTLDIWNEAYLVNTKAYTYGATKIDFSISFKDGYVIPRININVAKVAENSNTFSYTIPDNTYNENPPKRIYFNDIDGGEHLIETMTLTYTFTKYKITLNSNGGTGGLSSVQNPYNRAMPTISSSNLPTREGYTFQGYYDTSASTGGNQYYKANGTSAKTFTNKNDSLVLYARWALAQKPVNITKGTGLSNVYVSSNGNVTDASSSDLKSSGTNFAQGSTVYGYVKLAAGYQAQSGWALKAGTADTEGALYLVGSGTVSSSGYDFGTLNASTITYSIDYELNGGSVATANPTSYTIESDTFTLNNPTREGYDFLGWSEDGKSGYTETVTITKGTYGNKKYTAKWTLVAELQAVVDAINDLGGPTSISYPGSKTGLENAESLYSALNSDLKAVLDSDFADLVNELIEDRNQYDSLRSAAIDNAIDKIDAISEPISYPGSRDVVFAARDAVNALADEDKINTVVTNIDKYNDALDTYNALRDAAVEAVIEAIDNIDWDSEKHVAYPSSQSSIENARTLYEALAPEEKDPSTAVTNYGELTQAESEYASLRNDAIGEVIAAINAISKPFDENRESQISNAQSLYDALAESDKDPTYVTNYSRLEDAHAADDAADAIEALPTVSDTDEYRALVNETREAYDSLTSNQKGFIGEDILELLVSREQALLVIDAINNIGNLSYPGSKNLLDIANDLYAEYIAAGYPAEFIVNYQTLVDDNTYYNSADAVAALIKAIPAPSESDTYYDAVDTAKAAYDALATAEQALLESAIFDSETGITYAQYLADHVAARDVIERIQNIGQVVYSGDDDSLEAITYAETGYNALSDAQKAIVDSVNHNTLVKDRTDYNAVDAVAKLIELIPEAEASSDYYNAVDSAAAGYAQLTADQLAIINAATALDYEKVLADNVAARAVIEEIANIGTVTYDGGVNDSLAKIVSAETNYGNLSDDQKDIVNSANYSTLTDDRAVYDNVSAVADLIKAIPAAIESEEYYDAVDTAIAAFNLLSEKEQNVLKVSIFDSETGITYYQYLFNHVAARDVIERIQDIGSLVYGGEDDSLEAIVYAETGYNALSDAQKAIVDGVNHNTLVSDREIYNHVDNVADLILAIVPTEGKSYYDAVKKAVAAYNALTPEEQAILNNSVEADFEKILFDNLAASAVIEAIENIGELKYNGGTNDSLKDIELAEGLYELLSEDQKAIVDSVNYDTLVGDRASYDRVDVVVKLIEKIGEVKHDDETKNQLVVARTAYDALSEEEKALVSGYNNTYKTLVDDERVYETLVKIDSIGEVGYDSESQDKIKEARDYYDSLTEDQKEQLGEAPLATLVNSETEYARLEKNAKILVIILLIVTCLTILGGIWFLFFLLKKKRKDDDDNVENKGKGKPVKAMSVAGLLPGVALISHYLDAPYIALYVLAGVAVLLWISILAVVILKKKQVGPFKKKEVVSKMEPQASMSPSEDEEVETVSKMEPQASMSPSEDEEVETVSDEKGNIFEIRYIKSFTAKLSQSEKEVKDYYTVLKNYALSYKDAHSRVSWHYDAINVGRDYVMKFSIRGKTLCVYFALDASKLDEKYKVEEAKGKKFEEISTLYRIKNDRRCEYAKELIDEVMKKVGSEQGEIPAENYAIPHESTKALLAKGLIKELKTAVKKPEIHHHEHLVTSVNVEEADKLMSDEDAEVMIEEDKSSKKHEGKKAIINIDELEANFSDGDKITLEVLQEKKLIAKDVGRVKLLARGQLDKKLDVHLQDYSLQAVKMILLIGGKVQKAK